MVVVLETSADPGPRGLPGLLWREEGWDANRSFAVNDAVTYNGTSYRCRVAILPNSAASSPPNDGARWALFAAKGAPADPTVVDAAIAAAVADEATARQAADDDEVTARGSAIAAEAAARLAADQAETAARTAADTAETDDRVAAVIAEATTRQDADDVLAAAAAAAQATADAALPKAGGAMTGKITLDGDPVNNLHPATKQYVAAQIAALINGAPGTLDTLGEIAAALATDEGAIAALNAAVVGKLAAASNLSDLVDAVAARGNLGLGTAATHATGDFDLAGSAAAAQAASQPLAATLTTLAALNTTPAGRALLEAANAAALRGLLGVVPGVDVQAHDGDLDLIAALNTTGIGRSLLSAADATALRVILALGSAATHAATDFATTQVPAAWSGATNYAVGDLAIRGNAMFVCKTAHANHDPFTDCATVLSGAYWTFFALRGGVETYNAAAEQIDGAVSVAVQDAPTPDSVSVFCPSGLVSWAFAAQWKLSGAAVAASGAEMQIDDAVVNGTAVNGGTLVPAPGFVTLDATGLFWGLLASTGVTTVNGGYGLRVASTTADALIPPLPSTLGQTTNNNQNCAAVAFVGVGVHKLSEKYQPGNATTVVNVRERRLVAWGI